MNPFNLVFISLISSGNDILNEKSSSHFWSSLIIIYHLFSIMLLLILYFYSIILLCRICIICTKYNFILIRIPLKRKKFLKWIYLSSNPIYFQLTIYFSEMAILRWILSWIRLNAEFRSRDGLKFSYIFLIYIIFLSLFKIVQPMSVHK